MADVSKTVSILFRGEDQASPALRDIDRAIDSIGQGAAKIGDAGKEVDKLGASAGAARSLLAELGSAISVGLLAKAFIDANVEVERFTRGITAITGSGDAASREIEYLRATADRLGLAVRDTSGSYVNFLAAVKGTSLEGEPARKIFESIVSAMSKLGKSSDDTQGAILALQQAISKGKITAEELRGQLGERLPGAVNIFAKSMGITTAELDKLLEAGAVGIETLPRFAQAVDEASGGSAQRVEGYTASINRLKNAFDETLVVLGQSGIFDGVTASLQVLNKLVTAAGSTFDYFGTALRAAFNVARGGSLEVFVEEMRGAERRVQLVSAALDSDLNQSLAETARLTRQAGDATAEYDAEMAELQRQANAQTDALNATAAAFKTLGVDPQKAAQGVKALIDAFDTLARSSNVSGSQLLAGLEAALKRIDDKQYLPTLQEDLKAAFEAGRISLDQYVVGVRSITDAYVKLDKGAGSTTEALKRQAEAAKKAAEEQERVRLELEKLASNERIKLIEARVQINAQEVQAQTARIQAAFDSLNNTVDSTADVINKAFGVLGDQTNRPWIDNDLRNVLFEQIDRENENRERALKMQEELTRAQVDVLRQQANQLARGDALIRVDGSGLAPHLEAFMYEILKAVQVRTNRDGLRLLLGVA